jgi:hypothetical protein
MDHVNMTGDETRGVSSSKESRGERVDRDAGLRLLPRHLGGADAVAVKLLVRVHGDVHAQ